MAVSIPWSSLSLSTERVCSLPYGDLASSGSLPEVPSAFNQVCLELWTRFTKHVDCLGFTALNAKVDSHHGRVPQTHKPLGPLRKHLLDNTCWTWI